MSALQCATPPSASGPLGRVDIVSGSFGAGHDAAAGAIAEQLAEAGVHTRTWDIVDLMPGRLGRIVRSGYLAQVQSAPWSWRWLLDATERHDAVMSSVTRALESTERSLVEIATGEPLGFVSTHPFASQALGHLRGRGRLSCPVTTYLTDMSVHRMWVHPDVDLHLAIHPIAAAAARRLGAREVTAVRPAVSTRFTPPLDREGARRAARAQFALPPDGRLALVTGGSCGIGALIKTARDLLETGPVTPVVLCGSNRRLLDQVRRQPGMVGLGWTSEMPTLLSAVDVLVQNAGGSTSLEAAAMEVPLITYRSIAGHGEANAAALHDARTAIWARRPSELSWALTRSLHSTPHHFGEQAYLPSALSALFPQRSLIA